MNNNYRGAIIEESLTNKNVLQKINITKTEIIPYSKKLKTPWVKQWTFHYIEIPKNQADDIADEICKSLDKKHAWYADYKNEDSHYVIYSDRIFCIKRTNKEQYDKAISYGLSLGIPDHQLDFSPFKKVF